ncbi:hypothetical protein PWEIH_11810 [Listeria weihenstephanensis FSL R9-0317]|uniref:DUF3139 domain-containing protein n=1 Tax=Listeria weihenstephanensis TaxID=1006155 RepID=A0A1S7FV39_9LIST|nr:DUF3139 domain-containing protein [Listeria weihenstephanensis]AQY51227.1 hypothetical protein UE46_09290 [Listeria weihenstephanensis]EUJ36841.1 hypothetical protein PWEIH_11810 [Listeria weihenstephanensis FSL R9-0317]
MKKWSILGIVCIALILVTFTFVALHYNKKVYAEKQIDDYIEKQGIPHKDVYDEKYAWDWQKSGSYVKNFHLKGEDPELVYQYVFTAKGHPVIFGPYSPSGDYPKTKYPKLKQK